MKTIKIITPGGYTTVQDLGRFGFARFGVPVSGALDTFSAKLANRLVGNAESCALLELTVMGPSIEMQADMDIALTGARMPVTLNKQPVPQWTSVRVKAGDTLTVGMVTAGCRGYLAFGGGIDVPEAMGSFSTYVGGGLGGFKGRPLRAEDVLAVHPADLLDRPREVPASHIPDYPSQVTVRVVPGPQGDYFDMAEAPLFKAPYMVTAKADRMGYRLQGEAIPIRDGMPKSIVSEPAAPAASRSRRMSSPSSFWPSRPSAAMPKLPRLSQRTCPGWPRLPRGTVSPSPESTLRRPTGATGPDRRNWRPSQNFWKAEHRHGSRHPPAARNF